MQTDSDKKCIYFSGLRIPFKTIGPTYNKNVLNSVAFPIFLVHPALWAVEQTQRALILSCFLIFLRFDWSEMVSTWMVLDLLSKIITTFSLPLNKLTAYSPTEIALYSPESIKGVLPIWWSYSWFINDWFVRKLRLISSSTTLPSHLPWTIHLSQP